MIRAIEAVLRKVCHKVLKHKAKARSGAKKNAEKQVKPSPSSEQAEVQQTQTLEKTNHQIISQPDNFILLSSRSCNLRVKHKCKTWVNVRAKGSIQQLTCFIWCVRPPNGQRQLYRIIPLAL